MSKIELPKLQPDEINAGLIMKEDGTPDYWLILLPKDKDHSNWQSAMDWAKEKGGDLPTRPEQSLLFANAKQHFEGTWYWSNTTHDKSAEWAWCQGFRTGYQTIYYKTTELRARAVRRLPI